MSETWFERFFFSRPALFVSTLIAIMFLALPWIAKALKFYYDWVKAL